MVSLLGLDRAMREVDLTAHDSFRICPPSHTHGFVSTAASGRHALGSVETGRAPVKGRGGAITPERRGLRRHRAGRVAASRRGVRGVSRVRGPQPSGGTGADGSSAAGGTDGPVEARSAGFFYRGAIRAVDRRKAIGPFPGPYTDGGSVRGGSVAREGETGMHKGHEGRHDRPGRTSPATGESRRAIGVQPSIPTRTAIAARAAASLPRRRGSSESGPASAAASRPSDPPSDNHS